MGQTIGRVLWPEEEPKTTARPSQPFPSSKGGLQSPNAIYISSKSSMRPAPTSEGGPLYAGFANRLTPNEPYLESYLGQQQRPREDARQSLRTMRTETVVTTTTTTTPRFRQAAPSREQLEKERQRLEKERADEAWMSRLYDEHRKEVEAWRNYGDQYALKRTVESGADESQKEREVLLRRAREEVMRKAKEEALRRAKAQEEALRRAKAHEEALRKAKAHEEALKKAKAHEEALKKAREEGLKKAREEALRKAREEELKLKEEWLRREWEESLRWEQEREQERAEQHKMELLRQALEDEQREAERAEQELRGHHRSASTSSESSTLSRGRNSPHGRPYYQADEDDSYESEPGQRSRGEASKLNEEASTYRSKADLAFDEERASQGQMMMRKYRECIALRDQHNREASEQIFAQFNPAYSPTDGTKLRRLDLHGLFVSEALEYTHGHIENCLAQGSVERTMIITGIGNNSEDGIAKLKPAVEQELQDMGLRVVVKPKVGWVTVIFDAQGSSSGSGDSD